MVKAVRPTITDCRTLRAWIPSDATSQAFEYVPLAWLQEYYGQYYPVGPDPNSISTTCGLSLLQAYLQGRTPTVANYTADTTDVVKLRVY
jgi:hypothetical protein